LALEDSAQVKLDKLDALLVRTSTSKHDAALFAEPRDTVQELLARDPREEA
jgi:hypothetical protein